MNLETTALERQQKALEVVRQRLADAYGPDVAATEAVCINDTLAALRVTRAMKTITNRVKDGKTSYEVDRQYPGVAFDKVVAVANGSDVLHPNRPVIRPARYNSKGLGFHIDRPSDAIEGRVRVRLWCGTVGPTVVKFALARTIEEADGLLFGSGSAENRLVRADILPQSRTLRLEDKDILAFVPSTEIDPVTEEVASLGTPHMFSSLGPVAYDRWIEATTILV